MTEQLKQRLALSLSALSAIFLIAGGAVNLLMPKLTAAAMADAAFPPWTAAIIGAISLASGVLYAIPATSLLGAVLATGFLGGAIATHLRLGEVGSPPQLISLVAGVIMWLGLHLRGRVTFSVVPQALRPAG